MDALHTHRDNLKTVQSDYNNLQSAAVQPVRQGNDSAVAHL